MDWQTFEVTERQMVKTDRRALNALIVKQTGTDLKGTLYLIENPSYLVRWVLARKNGVRVTIDQELMRDNLIVVKSTRTRQRAFNFLITLVSSLQE